MPFLLFLGCESAKEAGEPQLSDFKSDGCSLFVDGTFKDRDLWKGCCVEHDVAYWQGGTKKERKQADLKKKCDALRDAIAVVVHGIVSLQIPLKIIP